VGQVRALVALRWSMVRDQRSRRGLLLLALSLPAMVLVGGTAGQVARDSDLSFNVLLLTPSLFLGFAVLTVVSPLANGGGSELYPPEQLVAYPIRPQTVFLASVVSAPLNLAWATQLVALVSATSFIADRGPGVLLAVLTTLAYVGCATVAGQALGWWTVAVSASARGRLVTRTVGLAFLASLTAVVLTGNGTLLLDKAPTTRVTIAALQGSQGQRVPWAVVTVVLLVATLVAWHLGARATASALRRPRHGQAEASRPHPRRGLPRTEFRALLRTDAASVWRSAPLRRGVLFLGVAPGAVAASVQAPWSALVFLPGLVAAGAGLLFAVNAKVVVAAQTCLVPVALSLALAAPRAPGAPTASEAGAIAVATLVCTSSVLATCLRLSVHHPHRADLRGPRDAPAPPAAMLVASLSLALSTTVLSMILVGLVLSTRPVLALRREATRFCEPVTRARIVTTVAAG
jgi:hypothetical protein